MPQSLFEISEDMHALDDLLFEIGGDVSDEKNALLVKAWIDELALNLKGKADNYAALVVTMEKRADVRKQEAKRLMERAAIDTKAAAYLRSKLKAVMEGSGIGKLETERFRISVAKNGGLAPLVIYDEKLIPSTYFIPQPDIIDNKAIREAIDHGIDVPGADLESRGTSLRIK